MSSHRSLLVGALLLGAFSCQCTPGGNQPPDVRIISPLDGAVLRGAGPFQLVGEATDPEEVLTAERLAWASDRQGLLGAGATLSTLLSPGAHRLTFQATDSKGASSSAQISITVVTDQQINTPPVVAIDAPLNRAFFDEGQAITLTGHATDAEDGTLAATALGWTSNKAGALGTGTQLTFSNAALGKHRIVLTATDKGGLSSVATIELEVVRPGTNRPPVVTIQDPADGAQVLVGAMVELRGTATDVEDGALTGARLVWTSSRDGALGTGSPLQRTLTQGVHTLTLTATDSMSATGSAQITVNVNAPNNQPPIVNITGPANNTTVFAGTSITFTGTGSDPEDGALTGTALSWSSNRDGVLGTGGSLSTTALIAGDHLITLIGRDSGGNTGSATLAVHVLPMNTAPVVSITAPANNTQVTAGTSVTFTATATDAEDGALSGAAVRWTSSLDGALGAGTSFATSSLTSGTHSVTVTATDSGGRSASATITLTVTGMVTNLPPIARITGPMQGEATRGLTFDGATSSDPDGTIAAYRFEFSDGAPAVTGMPAVTHTFATPGTFTVTLTVTDDRGATGSAVLTVTISPFVRVPVVVDATDELASAACSLTAKGTTLHVAWYSGRHPTVWYATWFNGTLSREVVDTLGFNTGGNIKGVLQLALDSAGNPHVIYGRDNQLWYATKLGGTWQRERVDSSATPVYALDSYPPSLALNTAGQPTAVYVTNATNRTVVIARRTAANTWTQTVPAFSLGTTYGSYLTGEATFGVGDVLYMPIQLYTSTTGGNYLSYLATWNGTVTQLVSMTSSTLPGFSAATSLAWSSSARLLALGGTGLFDIAVSAPLPTSTARMSYLETSSTSQHAVAVTATGEPRIVINHGSTLESVWPDGTPGFWKRFDLGPTDSGHIDAAVDSSGDTRACFFRAGKLVLY